MNAVRPGPLASIMLHASFLVAGLFVLPSAMPEPAKPMPVLPVELVTPGELSSITAAKPDAKEAEPLEAAALAQPEPEPAPSPDPQPERKITEAVAAPAPLAPAKQKAATPAPAPKPAPPAPPVPAKTASAPLVASPTKPAPKPIPKPLPPKAVAQAKPVPAVAPTPKAKPAPSPSGQKAKPAEATNQKPAQGLDLDQLAALTDRSVDSPSRRAPQMAAREGAFAKAERSRAAAGMATSLSGTLEDTLRSQISRCWRMPANSARAADLIVEIRIQFTPDGVVKGTPTMVRPSNLGLVDPALRAAAENGLRAIRMCQPYTLPAENYDRWRDVVWKFDPSQMANQ